MGSDMVQCGIPDMLVLRDLDLEYFLNTAWSKVFRGHLSHLASDTCWQMLCISDPVDQYVIREQPLGGMSINSGLSAATLALSSRAGRDCWVYFLTWCPRRICSFTCFKVLTPSTATRIIAISHYISKICNSSM